LRKRILNTLPNFLTYEVKYSFARNVKLRNLEPLKTMQKASEAASNIENQGKVFMKRPDAQDKKAKVAIPKPEKVLSEAEEASRALNASILTTENLDELFLFYQKNKEDFNIVNYATCLNRSLYLSKKARLPHKALKDKPVVQEIIEVIRSRFDELDAFGYANFIANLAKLDILDEDLIRKIVTKTLESNLTYHEKSLAFITWALCKLKIRHEEYLNYVSEKIISQVSHIRKNFHCYRKGQSKLKP